MAVQVITGSDYHAIAVYYGNVKTKLSSISGYLFDAVTQIVLLDTYEPTRDLLSSFAGVYDTNTNAYTSLIPFVPAVKAINAHVINRGGYATVDAYLNAKGITVPQAWADLCAAAGTTIDSDYISG